MKKTSKNQITTALALVILFCLILLTKELLRFNTEVRDLKSRNKSLELKMLAAKEDLLKYEEYQILQKDSMNVVINDLKDRNSKLISANKIFEEEIINIRKQEITIPEDILGMVNYFNERYNSEESQAIDSFVALGQDLSTSVIVDLEEKDKLEKIEIIRIDQIYSKDSLVRNLYLEMELKEDIITLAENEILKRKDLQRFSDSLIVNLKKENKVLKRQRILRRILYPLGIVGTGVGTYYISK